MVVAEGACDFIKPEAPEFFIAQLFKDFTQTLLLVSC